MTVRWYVTCSPHASDKDEAVWTLSLNPDDEGWRTDGGYPAYGLPKALAEELAAAANLVAAHPDLVRELVEKK